MRAPSPPPPESLTDRIDRGASTRPAPHGSPSGLRWSPWPSTSSPIRSTPTRMRHFVWQADAWLHGRFAISWPVSSGPLPNDFYLDVVPVPGQPGFGRTPYRPLPAIVILPAVAVFGLGTDAELVGAIIGAINAGLAWLIARQLATRPSVALAATLFFSFGTVAWIAAARASTWYLAHDLAILCTPLAVMAGLAGWQSRSGFFLGLATLAPPHRRLRDAVRVPQRAWRFLAASPRDGRGSRAADPLSPRLQPRLERSAHAARLRGPLSDRRGAHRRPLSRRVGDRRPAIHPSEPRHHAARTAVHQGAVRHRAGPARCARPSTRPSCPTNSE